MCAGVRAHALVRVSMLCKCMCVLSKTPLFKILNFCCSTFPDFAIVSKRDYEEAFENKQSMLYLRYHLVDAVSINK